MTIDALNNVPKLNYTYDEDIINDIKKANVYEIFDSFPLLYKLIRVSNLSSIKKQSLTKYQISFNHFVSKTLKGETIGEWNDYGRLNELNLK